MSTQTVPTSEAAPFAAFLCPLCKTAEHMAASQWGHHAVPLCHNPPCIYKRTLKSSRVSTPIRPEVESSWAEIVKDAPAQTVASNPATDRAVNILLRVGGKGQLRRLAMFLSDGKKRSAQEIVDAVGYPMQQVATAIYRLRSRPGIHIDCLAINKTTFYRMKV